MTSFDYLRPPAPATSDGAPNFQTVGPLTNGFGYNSAVCNEPAASAHKYWVGPSGLALNNGWLANITSSNWGVLLFDGHALTSNPLVLKVVNNANVTVASVSLNLNISNIEDMYRHLNLRTGHDAPNGLVGAGNTAIMRDNGLSSNYASNPNGPIGFPDSLNKNYWIVQMHGYNVSGNASRGWESEVFKELYWSHSHAKFVGVCWFGDPYDYSPEDEPNYQTAVREALISGSALKRFTDVVNNRLGGGNITIIAHSLGAMVVSSAMEDWGMNVTHAIFVDGGIAQEAFDGNLDENLGNMTLSSWYNGTPIYDRRLWAEHWWNFFSSSDARNELTWQNRFNGQNVSGNTSTTASKVYNFYSPTENVLATNSANPTYAAVQLVGDITYGDLGHYSWVIQEKTKGNQITVPNIIVSGSLYMGWGFNTSGNYWSSANTTSANSTSLTHAMSSPLFNNGYNGTSHTYTPDWLLYLFDTGLGSGAADQYRNQLLAEAIPALSLPVGANPVSKFAPSGLGGTGDRNSNIPFLYVDPNHWPRSPLIAGVPKWFHSDMHDVAYHYLFALYDQLVYISSH